MKDLPNPFWAALFMFLGCLLLLAVLLKVNNNTTSVVITIMMAVATAGSNIISGAFGYINGHRDGAASVSVPSQPSPTAMTTVTVGDPSQPVGPAQTQK